MPIRTKPWTEVTLRDVEELIPREIREDNSIEFKQQLEIENRDQRYEFLKDVSAMANANGGTIIFGAVEGDDEQAGRIVRLQGQQLINPDQVALQVADILRDGLDERLDGVLFKALPTATAGEYVCVMRIPASPLAPHRVVFNERAQFFLRGIASSPRMNTRQIRHMILQRGTAIDAAQALVGERTARLKVASTRRNDELHFNTVPFTDPDQVVLHVIPLFPQPGGWRLGPDRQRRLMSVPALGATTAYEAEFYALEGLYSRFPDRRHVLFLRGGGIEFQRYDVLKRDVREGGLPRLQAWTLEQDILKALAACAALTDDGLLPLPLMVSVRLLDVGGTTLESRPGGGPASHHPQEDPDVLLTRLVLHAWGPSAAEQIRQLFDEMFQAWHLPDTPNFYPDGRHHEYDRDGRVIPSPLNDGAFRL